MKAYLSSIFIAIAIIATAFIFSIAFKNRNRGNDAVSVTGLGKRDFVSDLIVWKGGFRKKNFDLKQAYAELDKDREIIKNYLLSKGVKQEEIIFSAVDIDEKYDEVYDKQDNRKEVFSGFELAQVIQIESKEVNKIEEISREVTELINSGVEFYSKSPDYFYTKLAALKIEMIAEATKDAHVRAEKIAENSGGKLGKLKKADMGVFQIVAQNSAEDFSWGGSYNTSSKKKTATITMNLDYDLE